MFREPLNEAEGLEGLVQTQCLSMSFKESKIEWSVYPLVSDIV